MSQDAYPLSWPVGWKRCSLRTGAAFRVGQGMSARKLTIRDGIKRVLAELDRMGVRADDVIISSNVKPHIMDSQGSNVSDPGVAVYWRKSPKEPQRVLAVDRYHNVADNLAALAATLDAMRAIERHGGAVVMDRAFEGFTALPPPTSERPWWEVLGVSRAASPEEIKAAHRAAVVAAHPDKPGGSHDKMAALNRARDAGLAERTLR